MENNEYKELEKKFIEFTKADEIDSDRFDKVTNDLFTEYNRRADLVLKSEEYKLKYDTKEIELASDVLCDNEVYLPFALVYPELDNLKVIINLEDISAQFIYKAFGERFNLSYPMGYVDSNVDDLKRVVVNENLVPLIKFIYLARAKEVYEKYGAMTEEQAKEPEEYIEKYII